ncbi:MAG: DUF362 domain-containing protein [Planctomycetota bacterium]|jgi:uncharacterized protein (DUF362 family)
MQTDNGDFTKFTRREFIQAASGGAAALFLPVNLLLADTPATKTATQPTTEPSAKKTDLWVFHGEDKRQLMDACMKVISDNGGFGTDVKKLTLKVNAAWTRTPKQGANTHPELVDTFLKGCKQQRIKQIVMPEHPCDRADKSFPKSGLLDVAKANGVKLIDLRANEQMFKDVEIPGGKRLKKAQVARDFIETDALVNIPVAKHHSSARLTCAMKNWMGAVWDRRYWHRNSLHQCIADFSTYIKPTWTIVDATRIMLNRGPKGPADDMKHPDQLILSRDQVAADVYASTLFPSEKFKRVKYLQLARDMKIGTTDIERMVVHKIELS